MTDRLVIEITGDLPDAGNFAILASAEDAAKDFASALAAKHPGVDLKVSVKAVRPGKRSPGPVVIPAAPPVPEPVVHERRRAPE
jgi:hypothetical protein